MHGYSTPPLPAMLPLSLVPTERGLHIRCLQCVCVSCSVMSDSLRPHGLEPTRLLCPWDSLGKNIGVGCHSLLQGVFLTQGLNPGLLHCRKIFHSLSH